MMMELTFDATARVAAARLQAPPATTRMDGVPARYVHGRLADDGRESGRDSGRVHEWHAGGRLLRRAEDAFAAVVLVSLLTLGTLTFGYAVDSLATAQAASVRAIAVSE